MQNSYQKGTVSVVIAAYNNPEYTRKTLKSIVEQNYRPIEVILSDDNSPNSLEMLAAEFDQFQGAQFNLKYFRQASNLGVSDNFAFAVNHATGQYLIPMSHDNWFTEKNFIADAVEVLKTNTDCYMCVANCRFEDTNQELLTLPDDIKAKDCWEILHGGHFIPLWRSGGLGWTQAYLLDTRIAHKLGAFEEPYMLNKPLANKLALADDTLWGFVFVMAAIGSVALTGKVVCVAGRPERSYSRSSPKWLQTRTKAKFVILYNIYRSNLKGPSAQIAKDTAKRQALDQARQANLFDLKILRHYKFSPEIIYYSSAYLLKKLRRSIKNFNKRAKQRLKGIVNR